MPVRNRTCENSTVPVPRRSPWSSTASPSWRPAAEDVQEAPTWANGMNVTTALNTRLKAASTTFVVIVVSSD